MAKNINVVLALKDQFTSPLQRAQKNTKSLNREFKKASNSVKAFGNSVKNGMKKVAKATTVGFLAVSAAATLFAKESIDAVKAQLKAEKNLTDNMKRSTNATQEQIQSVKNLASALQNEGVIGDEVALAGAARLAVYKLNNEQINKLLPNLNDMLAHEKGFNATQEDSIAMADAIGKALDGKVKGLLKYGVVLTENENKLFKTMSQEERLNLISKKLTSSIGGTNKSLRNTDEGKIVAVNNAWGDMKEELGKKLLPYLGKFAEWFETKIPQIQNFILSIASRIEEMVNIATPYIISIKNFLGSVFDEIKPAMDIFINSLVSAFSFAIDVIAFFKNNWDVLSPSIYTVVGALIAYKTVMLLSNTYTLAVIAALKLKASWDAFATAKLSILTIAQWAFNAALTANPIGVIIALIGVLIAIGWTLYKNWDKISVFFSEMWGKIKTEVVDFCTILKDFFMQVWNSVVTAVVDFGNYLKDIFMGIWNSIVDAFTTCYNFLNNIFLAVWEPIKEAFNSVCSVISDIFMPIWDGLISSINTILHPIDSAKEAIGGLIDKFKFWEDSDKDISVDVNENKNKNKNLSTTPSHALGTSYFAGGVTGINEGGRSETAILPSGTKILSHEQSKASNSPTKIEVNLNISGNVIGNKEFMEQAGEYIAQKIKLAIGNI